MSETQDSNNDVFAFGAFETDSSQFNITCECPTGTVLGPVEASTIYNNSTKIKNMLEYYDNYCREYYTEGTVAVGIISEEEAKKAWQSLLDWVEDNSKELDNTQFDSTEELACHVSDEIGWNKI